MQDRQTARYFDRKCPRPPGSMYAPAGAIYLINITHPMIREEYEREKRELHIPCIYPMSDMQRQKWEVDIIKRYGHMERMPDDVKYRLRLPPYYPLIKAAYSDGIKKDRQGG